MRYGLGVKWQDHSDRMETSVILPSLGALRKRGTQIRLVETQAIVAGSDCVKASATAATADVVNGYNSVIGRAVPAKRQEWLPEHISSGHKHDSLNWSIDADSLFVICEMIFDGAILQRVRHPAAVTTDSSTKEQMFTDLEANGWKSNMNPPHEFVGGQAIRCLANTSPNRWYATRFVNKVGKEWTQEDSRIAKRKVMQGEINRLVKEDSQK